MYVRVATVYVAQCAYALRLPWRLLLPVNVVVELVVAGKCEQNSKARSKREEDLRGCINPHLVEKQHHRCIANCNAHTFVNTPFSTQAAMNIQPVITLYASEARYCFF